VDIIAVLSAGCHRRVIVVGKERRDGRRMRPPGVYDGCRVWTSIAGAVAPERGGAGFFVGAVITSDSTNLP
jgi:hypothetical protein